MPEVTLSETVAVTAAELWALVGRFEGLAEWAPIERCVVSGSGVGAVRVITDPSGMEVRERLVHLDDARRILSYTFEGAPPLPIRDYLSTIRVHEEGTARSRFEWIGRFEPDGAPAEVGERIVRQVYEAGLASLLRRLRP